MDIPSTSSGDANYQQWSQVIECPICYTIYDKPMQMGCGHTLCSTCVGKLVEQAKNNQIEELRFPHIARMQMNFEDGVIGLGGGPDAFDDQQWLEVPAMEQRDPMLRAFIGFPGAPPGRRRDANPNGSTEIKCPECRKPTIVPADGLPINYRVQEIVGKVAPLFKDRHLVKYCNQCEEVLAGGVYFDCSDCQEKNSKICSTCAIRTHNGHKLVEKKALTSDDVRQMKQKINDVSARAFQALEGIKNAMSPVGGALETKVIDKLSGFIKVFEFMNTSFDSKIKETSTVDELMMDVQKAEQVANLYERSQDRVKDMLNSIEAAVVTYWQPFDQLRQDLNFEMEDGIVAPAPPAPTPAPVAPPPAPQNNQLMDQLNDIPAAAMRALRRPVGQHNLQVERMRLRNRNLFPAPPMQHQPPQQQQQQLPPPPPPQQHPQQQAPRGNNGNNGHNGPPPPQINFPVWQPAPQMGHAMGPHINMMPGPMRGPPRMMQQQQGPPQPPPPPMGNFDLLEILQVGNNLRQGPMPQPMRLNAQNLHNMAHQHNQNVPMPPQMPNFQQQQMHMRHQQMMQNGQVMRMPPPPPPQPQFQGHPPGPRPMQQYMQIMPQQPQQQQQQQPQQMQPMPQNLQQNLQQVFQQQPQMQQPIVHQIQLQAPLQPPPQQLQQPPIQEQPVGIDELPPPNEPVWNNEPPMGFGQPQMGFEGQPEEGEEEEGEEQQPDVAMVPPPEDYAPAGALDMLRFQEVVGGDVLPRHHLGPQLMNNDINGVEADLIVEADDVDDQDQFEEAVEEFGEFQEMQQAVDGILPVLVPEEIVLNNDDVVVPPELNAPVLVEQQGIQDVPEVVEEEDADEEEEEVYENPRRGGAPQDNTRRNTRRSVRSSAEEGPSTSSGNRSTSPSTSTKRRRMERKPKSEEPEPMEEDEPVDTVHRPPKRRAAASSSSGASSSGASTSSAPTTRSQTRS
ncbi:Protein CBR-TAM-1 [Caenorhabditis briggsae]|nr:Protein CBR-TAM-1 [Caenorhabditis briggsae]CAP37537.1 Protein CBR-TAM-1 [Caenorhabditis briggsae]